MDTAQYRAALEQCLANADRASTPEARHNWMALAESYRFFLRRAAEETVQTDWRGRQ
jgi:hypothetical protein